MSRDTPSTFAWFAIHILIPLFPFLLEGFIRLFIIDGIKLNTFSAVTLSISSGFLAVFVSHTLKDYEDIPSDRAEEDSVKGASVMFLLTSIVFFALFGLLVTLRALVVDKNITEIKGIYKLFQVVVFALSVVPVTVSVAVQRSFKLKASASLW